MPPFYNQQPGPMTYQPWQSDSYNSRMGQETQAMYGAQAASNQAKYGYMGQEAQARYGAQSNKDTAAFGAFQNLGIAGQNAMANYGASRNNALLNSQIAQANAAGQMGSQYFNTYGQGMNVLQGLNAAASQAGADYNKADAFRGAFPAMTNAAMYGSQAGAYGMGNMPNFSVGGFGGGFQSNGPEGTLASGNMGMGAGGRRFNAPPPPPYMQQSAERAAKPYEPFSQSLPALQRMMRGLDNPNNFANAARGDINAGFYTTQKNLMDTGVLDSLNGQMAMGYDRMGNLYKQSNYGFNTNQGNTGAGYHPSSRRFSY